MIDQLHRLGASARRWICATAVIGFSLAGVCATYGQAPFTIQGPGVDPTQFRITTFASNLNYPVGMVELDDGSILTAVSNGSFFGSTSGAIVRLADTNGDGVADERRSLVRNVPGGGLSSLRRAGNLVITTGQGQGKPIMIYRLGAQPTDNLTEVGRMTLNYPGGGWLHPHSALGVRETPGQPGSYDLLFQLGSDRNFAETTNTVPLTSTIGVNGNLAGDAVHMVTLTDDGTTVTGSNLRQIATGLRNAAGFDFHPLTGDLYLEDNGIDGFQSAIEPESADELNTISFADIGGSVEDFGFPFNYIQYRTETFIGGGDIPPLVDFQPIPNPLNGSEAEGPNDIAFTPAGFPGPLRNGMFVGMHGQFSQGGLTNEENPLVFVDLDDNSYFHFVGNNETQVGHLDGLLATEDSLFVADISKGGGFGSSSIDSGVIYQIKSLARRCDLNGDNAVNAADAGILFTSWGTLSLVADLNRDGFVDAADAGTCFTEWTGDGARSAQVPEPLGALLWIAAAIASVARSRRERRRR